MTRALLQIFVLLLVGTGLILLAERIDVQHQAGLYNQRISNELRDIRQRLQAQFDQLVSQSEQLAGELTEDPGLLERLDQHPVVKNLSPNAAELTLSFTREYKVVAAFPVIGSESVLGINFFLSPEFMTSIRRALRNRQTTIDSRVTLRQTNKQGIIIRTPYFSNDTFLGLVTSAVDLKTMLNKAGWNADTSDFKLLIEEHMPGHSSRDILGNEDEHNTVTGAFTVRIPEQGIWQLRAAGNPLHHQGIRSDMIRLFGGGLMFLLIVVLLRKNGILLPATNNKQGWPLHSTMLLASVIPIVLLVMAIALLSFNANRQATERLMQQQTGSLAKQIRARVEAFFDIPRQAAFDVELFRNGVLDPAKPEQMLSIFLSQLRVQPQLTFLSMANTQGEYYAASRPPAGNDRNVRLQFATRETGREMRIHWVGQANEPSEAFILGNKHFDARSTRWYQQAVNNNGLHWYPVYRYSTQDSRNQYDGLGIGISSALHDAQNRFIGVITADVALLQLSNFLKAQASELEQTTIFIAETDGNLLATSDESPVFHPHDNQNMRIAATKSDNSLIRAAGALIHSQQKSSGNMFIWVDNARYLLDWQTISLPEGPGMHVAIIMPQSWNSTASQVFRNVLYLTALFLAFGMVAVLFLVTWLSRPMQHLESWAKELGSGKWQAPLPPASPVREIHSLTHSLGSMANQLRASSSELEQRVADRTRELAAANKKLAELSLTDALTGIANRRRFDDFIHSEWRRSQRHNKPLALLMIDIDYFKPYNDHYGHLAGDHALVLVAQTLSRNIKRAGELLCRYGGEEFAIVLSETELDSALALAEKLRAAIIGQNIEHLHSELGQLSISIGVSAQIPDPESNLEQFIAAADTALYQAKNDGRNLVRFAVAPDA